jgi:hypothetical protein
VTSRNDEASPERAGRVTVGDYSAAGEHPACVGCAAKPATLRNRRLEHTIEKENFHEAELLERKD